MLPSSHGIRPAYCTLKCRDARRHNHKIECTVAQRCAIRVGKRLGAAHQRRVGGDERKLLCRCALAHRSHDSGAGLGVAADNCHAALRLGETQRNALANASGAADDN